MKVNAYILAADPAWIEASVLSYYDLVDRIVVSYDADGRSWTGVPIDVEQCLRRLRAADRAGKLDFCPGHFARPDYFQKPMESETHQRQTAFDRASDGADWVLQLDTDEVIGDARVFEKCLAEAHQSDRSALNYPSIWLYTHAIGRWYLEWCRRGWRRVAGYPGPVAARSGAKFLNARRVANAHYHVDLSRRASSGAFPSGISVDRVIPASAAIWHLSMVRSEAFMRRKLATTAHAHDRDWNPEIRRWSRAAAHPLWMALLTQFERGNYKRHLRLTRVPSRVANLLGISGLDEESSESANRPAELRSA